MMNRAQDLCRRLKPVLGKRIDGLWMAYLAEPGAQARAEIEQTLELLAARHLGQDYQPDRSPFPPPPRMIAGAGDIALGSVFYGGKQLYPFALRSSRLKEHVLIAGRSGSGKTNLTFMLMRGLMNRGIKVLALDWKRAYRDLLALHPTLRVYTVGRDVSPFRFNPFIPPPGCEAEVWIKLVVDVIASAYLGGEGVISLLVGGLDHLCRQRGVFDGTVRQWPTVEDLLAWLRGTKLRGRAAMWQASAERILVAMTYGEFGAVLRTQDNSHVRRLLDHNVVLEMDGLPSSADRAMFSEVLTLYMYRYRLAQGPVAKLTNVIVLEEAHNLLMARQPGTKESVLETSIRMIRQYGLGYVFVDQSASLLSKVAFANSYATFAMSQKLRGDVQAMASAMNLNDDQREALSTLSVGTAVARLADEHPEPFLLKIPLCPVREGSISDSNVRARMAACSAESGQLHPPSGSPAAISAIPLPDTIGNVHSGIPSHPPALDGSPSHPERWDGDPSQQPACSGLTQEEVRFLHDVVAHPLSTTVERYQRLTLSRRRGNAIRKSLLTAGLIQGVPITARTSQIMLSELTEAGRTVCRAEGVEPGAAPRSGPEHRFWVARVARRFADQGYTVREEYPIEGNGFVDLVAEKPGDRVGIEVETGKSDIRANLEKTRTAGFDRVVLVPTSPHALAACQRALGGLPTEQIESVEVLRWLDID